MSFTELTRKCVHYLGAYLNIKQNGLEIEYANPANYKLKYLNSK